MNEITSKTISNLRFPLIVGVVFLHNYCLSNSVVDWSDFSTYSIYQLVVKLFSGILPSMCVPTFFLMSGYLFFINIEKLDGETYKKKLKSRFWTLLVPYILWNLIPIFIKMLLLIYRGGLMDFVSSINWLDLFWNDHEEKDIVNVFGWSIKHAYPINGALWYVRDLIVLSVLTPAIYYFVVKLKKKGVFLLSIAFVFMIWPYITLYLKGVCFFTMGAYFGINKIEITQLRFQKYALFLSFFLCIVLLIFPLNPKVYSLIQSVFTLSSVYSIFFYFSWIIRKYNVVISKSLLNSVFFIYALHGVYVNKIMQNIVAPKVFGYTSNSGLLLCEYLFSVFMTLAICYFLFQLLSKVAPKLVSILDGKR